MKVNYLMMGEKIPVLVSHNDRDYYVVTNSEDVLNFFFNNLSGQCYFLSTATKYRVYNDEVSFDLSGEPTTFNNPKATVSIPWDQVSAGNYIIATY